MGALRIEVPEVARMIGLKPEGRHHVGADFDETGFVVGVSSEARSTCDGPHDMPSDGETTENRVLRLATLRHDDIRLQDA